jgi:hypothetical protein
MCRLSPRDLVFMILLQLHGINEVPEIDEP